MTTQKVHTGRIRLASILIILFGVVLIGKLYYIQIVQGKEYSLQADKQYIQSSGRLYNRGDIFFTDKENHLVSAATLKSGYKVAINPGSIDNSHKVFRQLKPMLDIKKTEFIKKANKKDDPYEEIAHRIKEKKAKKINEKRIPGVATYLQRWRFYPADELASHEIGFVAYKGDELKGRYGLERYYNEVLSRKNKGVDINFFAKVFSNIKSSLSIKDTHLMGDVVTTIEPSVQLFLENRLEQIRKKYDSETTGGIIINPQKGNIYAMSAKPNFNLNKFGKVEDPSLYSNPLVDSVYEMGSIIKSFTMAAGLDSGAVTPKTTYYDKGYVKINGHKIYNYDKQGRGEINMQEVLNHSLNTGAAFAQKKMGKETFAEYMKDYELGQKTDINLPNEAEGMTDNLNSSRRLEYATASFGQGIAMTPIATVKALTTLANKGRSVAPKIVKRIEYESGLSKKITKEKQDRVLTKKTANTVTRMLIKVADDALWKGGKGFSHYSVALKTGTAQIPNHQEGGYYKNKYLHSFFGYFPAYDPKFLIFFYTVNPQGVRYSSNSLAPAFRKTVDFLINYYNVPPDR